MNNQQAMAVSYSNGQAHANKTASQLHQRGQMEEASAWQMTQRAWFQFRAEALGITDAMLSTFGMSQHIEAHAALKRRS